MAHEPDTYVQKFLAKHYDLILNVSKTFSKEYEDLAHDVCVEITRCSECLKRVTDIKNYIFIVTRNIFINRDKPREIVLFYEQSETPDELSPHTIQREYYDHPELSSDEKFLLDLYLESGLHYGKTASAIHMNRRHVTIKIKTICQKLRSSG